jgi:hypothetical protein
LLLPNLGGLCPYSFRDHRIEFAIVQQSSTSSDLSADFDHHGALRRTRSAAYVPTESPAPAGRPTAGPQARVRTHALGQAVVLEVTGRLRDVVEDLDRAIKLALAEEPRGVVCDLSAVAEGAEADTADLLAAAGRHVRDWPGIPVAVACPDPQVRAALAAHPLGGHLIVTESVLGALAILRCAPIPDVEWLHLAPQPSSSRAARDFVTRILLGWGLGPFVPSASLVVSELVTNATVHAGTEIDLSVAWNLGALRLTVRDHGPALQRQRYSQLDLHGRGLSLVDDLARALGVLPTADGGKVVWAVLDAARACPLTNPGTPEPEPATTAQEPAISIESCGPSGLPSAPSAARTQPTTGQGTGSGKP